MTIPMKTGLYGGGVVRRGDAGTGRENKRSRQIILHEHRMARVHGQQDTHGTSKAHRMAGAGVPGKLMVGKRPPRDAPAVAWKVWSHPAGTAGDGRMENGSFAQRFSQMGLARPVAGGLFRMMGTLGAMQRKMRWVPLKRGRRAGCSQ